MVTWSIQTILDDSPEYLLVLLYNSIEALTQKFKV